MDIKTIERLVHIAMDSPNVNPAEKVNIGKLWADYVIAANEQAKAPKPDPEGGNDEA